jgi:hypothetical protein
MFHTPMIPRWLSQGAEKNCQNLSFISRSLPQCGIIALMFVSFRTDRSGAAFVLLLARVLLVACGSQAPGTSANITPTPLVVTPLADALGASGQVTTAGYLYIDGDGTRLVDSLSFSDGPTPRPLAEPAEQLWIDGDLSPRIQQALRPSGPVRLAVVAAAGQLDGPGGFGPAGRYRYRLRDAQIQPLVPIETSVAALLDDRAVAEAGLVRINGFLLANDVSEVLIDRAGAGGIPERGARQIKLRVAHPDRALLAKLRQAPSGTLRYGQVQVEGIWRDRVLLPLSIVPIS